MRQCKIRKLAHQESKQVISRILSPSSPPNPVSQSHLQLQSRLLAAGSPSSLLHPPRTENDAVIPPQVSSPPVPFSKPLTPLSIPCKPTSYSDQGSRYARDAGTQSSDIHFPSFSPSPTIKSHPQLCSRLHAAASSLSGL